MLLLPQIYSQNFLGQYNFLCILLHFPSIVCTISNDWLLLSFHSRQLLPHIENTFCSTNIPCILFPLSSPHSKFFSHFLNQIHFFRSPIHNSLDSSSTLSHGKNFPSTVTKKRCIPGRHCPPGLIFP